MQNYRWNDIPKISNRKASMKAHFAQIGFLATILLISISANIGTAKPAHDVNITISNATSYSIQPANITRIGQTNKIWENLSDPYFTFCNISEQKISLAFNFSFDFQFGDQLSLYFGQINAVSVNITIFYGNKSLLFQENITDLGNYSLDLLPFLATTNASINLLFEEDHPAINDYICVQYLCILGHGTAIQNLVMASPQSTISLEQGILYTIASNTTCLMDLYQMPARNLVNSSDTLSLQYCPDIMADYLLCLRNIV